MCCLGSSRKENKHVWRVAGGGVNAALTDFLARVHNSDPPSSVYLLLVARNASPSSQLALPIGSAHAIRAVLHVLPLSTCTPRALGPSFTVSRLQIISRHRAQLRFESIPEIILLQKIFACGASLYRGRDTAPFVLAARPKRKHRCVCVCVWRKMRRNRRWCCENG